MSAQVLSPGVPVAAADPALNRVVAVATAIPIFVGYTELARNGAADLTYVPTMVSSMAQFLQYFGSAQAGYRNGAPPPGFLYTTEPATPLPYQSAPDCPRFHLYYSMALFFANGGSSCYVLSIGSYAQAAGRGPAPADYAGVWPLLAKCGDATMLLLPDALLLTHAGWSEVSQQALCHCAIQGSLIAIFDVWHGYLPADGSAADPVRGSDGQGGCYPLGAFNACYNSYGVAYYPWIHTCVVGTGSIDYTWLSAASRPALVADLTTEAQTLLAGSAEQRQAYIDGVLAAMLAAPDPLTVRRTHLRLQTVSPLYRRVIEQIAASVNLLPPGGAIAGVYASNDAERGVWHTPANTGIVAALAAAVSISDSEQAALSTPPDGIAINAIRNFPNRGLVIWGARTLDGNSSDWRYISVRRTAIMLEQSIKFALQSFMYQPNDAPTWAAVNALISRFLHEQWQAGALVGERPGEAYSVAVGVGSTMNEDDVACGYLRLQVLLALARPAEFTALSFVQEMPPG